jgi:predicted CXXCH cytochrome family protein
MKRRLLICLISLFMLVAVMVAIVVIQPQKVNALNPNHSCDICHTLHNAPGQKLNSFAVVEDLCLSCHGPAGTSVLKAEIHTNKQNSSHAAFSMTCMDCHNPHDDRKNVTGGTNIKMVGSRLDGTGNAMVSTPNSGIRDVVFQSRGTDAGGPSLHSFADNDEDGNGTYDGSCEVCHTAASNHRNNSSGNHDHYTGQDCTSCHGHNGGFIAQGGGCTACHGSPQDKGDGGPTRRAINGEFSLTSHHVSGGTANDDDCSVCHYESVDGAYHQDNKVDLRNPDDASVGALISFAQFSRNTTSDSLESWVTDVQDNFCMKCHDIDGATATNFSGNALQPFTVGSRDVPNVYDRLNSNNASHHAVRGAGNNPYCAPSTSNGNNVTMASPWNQDSTHDVISCFDCHNSSGHGAGNQRMLRTAIDLDAMEAGNSTNAIGGQVETYCTLCHKASVYVSGTDPEALGSIFEDHGGSQSQHRASGGNELGCIGCHGGIVAENGGMPPGGNGTARGNIHGNTFVWPSGTFSAGDLSEHFMLGGWIDGWNTDIKKGSPIGACGGGTCNHSATATRSGKDYTR